MPRPQRMFGAIIAGVATYAAAREYRKAREYDYYPYRYGYAPYRYYGGYKYKPGRNYGYVPYKHKYSGSRLVTKGGNNNWKKGRAGKPARQASRPAPVNGAGLFCA